jgi:hypothetical protein
MSASIRRRPRAPLAGDGEAADGVGQAGPDACPGQVGVGRGVRQAEHRPGRPTDSPHPEQVVPGGGQFGGVQL